VQVLIYRRELRPLSLRRHRLRRLHRKVVVVDGRVAFVGGINIVDDFDAGMLPHPRYDYAVQVEGPLLEPIVASAQRLWRLVAWASFRRRESQPLLAPPRIEPAGDIRAAYVVRDNLRYRHAIENAYLDAIAAAREEIVIANAYFFPGRRFRQALVDAAERGVRVTLLLQGLSDHPLQVYATRALYPMFLARGIRLFEYHRSHMHAKVAVVDRQWSTVGSSNIDAFSLLLAREANVVVDDAGFAGRLRASLEAAICAGARELKASDWQRLPLLRRGMSWLAYQVVRLAIGVAGFGRSH
jgi:cardiolipin synthase